MTETFFKLTQANAAILIDANLTAAEWKIWAYLSALEPFGDRGAKYSPTELMLRCGVSRSTYFRAKARFEELGLFRFQDGITTVFNLQTPPPTVNVYSSPSRLREGDVKNDTPSVKDDTPSVKDDTPSVKDDTPKVLKPLPNLDSKPPQTIQTIKTNQTIGVGGKIELKKESISDKASAGRKDQSEENNLVDISAQIENFCGGVVRNTTNIDTQLVEKLKEFGIPLDDRVRDAIAQHHISQAWGAIHHIEETWETISNPRGVFLYQLPRQEKEIMGARSRVTNAADYGFTLKEVQKMYPETWREAAPHFGISIPTSKL